MPGQVLKLVGMVQRVRRITTKKGAMMAFVTMEGPGGATDVVVFPRTYESYNSLLIPNRVLVVCGKLDNRPDRDEHPVLADWLKEPHDFLLPVDGPYAGPEPLDSMGRVSEDSPSGYDTEPHHRSGGGNGNGGGGGSPRHSRPSPPRAMPKTKATPPSSEIEEAPAPPPTPAEAPNKGNGSGSDHSTAAVPPEPPDPPATLYITLKRTGDNTRDFEKLTRLHAMLRTERGSDQFVVVLEGERKIELDFPNESTHCTYDLRQQIVSVVGAENLRVVQQQGQW